MQDQHQTNKAYTQQIIDQLPTDKNIYLILDTAQFDALNLVFASGQQTELSMLYHATELQDQLKISPIIVKYDAYLQSKYQEWRYHAVAFSTTTDLHNTGEHLKSLIYCKMPNTQPAFFRFYAQSWLEPLLINQSEKTLYEFTGPIDNWFIPTDDEKWQQITIQKQTPSKTAQDKLWFTLTEELQTKLAEHSYQRFIDELTMRYSTVSLDTPEGQSFRAEIKKYAEQAKSYGLEQKDHITEYIDLTQCYAGHIDDDHALKILATNNDTPANKLTLLSQYLRDPQTTKVIPNEDSHVATTNTPYRISL